MSVGCASGKLGGNQVVFELARGVQPPAGLLCSMSPVRRGNDA